MEFHPQWHDFRIRRWEMRSLVSDLCMLWWLMDGNDKFMIYLSLSMSLSILLLFLLLISIWFASFISLISTSTCDFVPCLFAKERRDWFLSFPYHSLQGESFQNRTTRHDLTLMTWCRHQVHFWTWKEREATWSLCKEETILPDVGGDYMSLTYGSQVSFPFLPYKYCVCPTSFIGSFDLKEGEREIYLKKSCPFWKLRRFEDGNSLPCPEEEMSTTFFSHPMWFVILESCSVFHLSVWCSWWRWFRLPAILFPVRGPLIYLLMRQPPIERRFLFFFLFFVIIIIASFD